MDVSESQAYIPKRRTLIQVLPPANAYTKSANAYIHFVKSFCCLLMHYAFFLRIAISHSMGTLLVYALSAYLQFSGKMHICMSKQQKDLHRGST